MRLNIFMFLLISSTHFVDVESDIIEEMYKSLKNLEESVASNKNQMEIISQKIDDNIDMVEELKNDLVSIRNDNNEAKTCSKGNRGSTGSSNLYSLSHSGWNVTTNFRFYDFKSFPSFPSLFWPEAKDKKFRLCFA